MYTVKFRATQRDIRTDKIMKAAAKVENVGFAVVISFNTEQEPTLEYLTKMAKEIEENDILPNYVARLIREGSAK